MCLTNFKGIIVTAVTWLGYNANKLEKWQEDLIDHCKDSVFHFHDLGNHCEE